MAQLPASNTSVVRPADSDPQWKTHKAVEKAELSNIRGNAEEA